MSTSTALDFETFCIGPGAVFPKPVCYTLARRQPDQTVANGLVGNGDAHFWSGLERLIDDCLLHGHELVTHNGPGFDLPVAALWNPNLMSKVWLLLEKGLVRDVMIREMLLNLALHGFVDNYFTPDGKKVDVRYNLATLVAKYLGHDRTKNKATKDDKTGKTDEHEDVWQLHFDTLDGQPGFAYPVEAAQYALDDTDDTLRIFESQNRVAYHEFVVQDARFPAGIIGVEPGTLFDPFRTESLHCGAAFGLGLMTYVGFGIDHENVKKMRAAVEHALRPDQIDLLYKSGILEPAQPPRPYANGARNPDGTPKMTAGKPQKKSLKRLLEIVLEVHRENARCDDETCSRYKQECAEHGLPPLERNEPTERNPEGSICMDAEAIESLAPYSKVLAQYAHWQGLGKLLTLEIPVIESTDVIHGVFDIFKKTSRTSSRSSKYYPSRNLQQVPRGFDVEELDAQGKAVLDEKGKKKVTRIEPRRCYKARTPGWILVSTDYSYLELCTLAQTVYKILGYSRLRDVINSGADPHAWLGAQLAFGSDEQFAARCMAAGAVEPDAYYRVFKTMKHGDDHERSFFKTYRGLAKPVGLALGGGMGARRLLEYAWQTYRIEIGSIEKAKQYRSLWMDQAFPEMREYLNRYIRSNMRDDKHSSDERERFAYFSPLGTYRARCSYTEAANGFALQSPAGEGFKLAVFDVSRACWDPAQGSILYGCHPLAAIHDEIITEIPNDQWAHERAFEQANLMIRAMRNICPDVIIKVEPALMERWEKNAEPVYGPDGRLRVWRPNEKYTVDAEERLRSAA